MAQRPVVVGHPLEQALVDQAGEALGEDVAADVEVALEVLEPAGAVVRLAQHERRPPVAEQVHRAGHGAGPLRERGPLHAAGMLPVGLRNGPMFEIRTPLTGMVARLPVPVGATVSPTPSSP